MYTPTRTVKRLTAAVALFAAAVVAVGPAPSASASSVTAVSGTSGSVSFPGPMMIGVDAQVLTDSGYGDTLQIMSTGLSVGASPVSDRPQNVQVRLAFQMMNGDWETYSQVVMSGTADASTEAGFGQVAVLRKWAFRDYRLMYTIIWTDAATGAPIAEATVEPSVAGDSRCTATKAACTSLGDRIRA